MANAAEKVAAKEAEHVIAKAVQKAGVRDAEKVAVKDAEKTAAKETEKTVEKQAANGVPLSQKQVDDIIATPKGQRPDPSEYLPKDYIDNHLSQFDDGASRIMTESNLNKYGIAREDGTSFVMPKSEADDLLAATGGDKHALEDALGLPRGQLDIDKAVRVDIPDPRSHGLRMPSGNEAGANPMWIPGGKLPDGASEAVIDGAGIPAGGMTTTPIP